MMKYTVSVFTHLIVILGSLALGSAYYWYAPWYPSVAKAVAVVHPTKSNSVTGTVTFLQEKRGVRITATLKELAPGTHGFHIHELGDCSCPDATCAQGHFNPAHTQHGGPNSNERHAGDMGNVTADENGVAQYEYVDHLVQLNGPDSIIGRAIIVHEKPDDLVSQPTGDAGARIGCGVIGIAQH